MKRILTLLTLAMACMAFGADYHVPTPEALQASSEYQPTGTSATVTNGVLEVHYCLPPELVGDKAPEFQFTGTMSSNFVAVKGSDVYGYCMVSTDKPLTCMLKYPGLENEIDMTSRDAAIRAKFAVDDLPNRFAVANLFHSEPAGLLTIDITQ